MSLYICGTCNKKTKGPQKYLVKKKKNQFLKAFTQKFELYFT